MLRMRVTALVMAAIPIGVGHAETDAACQPVEVAAPGFFVGETTLAGVPIKFSASTSYQFSESELDGKKMMAIDEIVKMDMEDLRTKWPAIASNKVPPSSCDDRYKPHGFSLRNEGGKSALGTMAVTYENWSCKWTYGTCTTTGRKHGIPYPKLYKCKWEVKNKNFQKTVDIKTRFSPVIKDGNLSIDVASSLDDRGGIPDGLLNVVGVLTLNVGSKFMRDNYEATIDSIRAQLPKFEYSDA